MQVPKTSFHYFKSLEVIRHCVPSPAYLAAVEELVNTEEDYGGETELRHLLEA
jgi:hypothetical protein